MKIIFKPTNRLVEKLILDERLILDEADDLLMNEHTKKFAQAINTLDKQIAQVKQILDDVAKKNNTEEINELLNDKNTVSIPRLKQKTENILNDFKNKNINKLVANLQSYIVNIKNLTSKIIPKCSTILVENKNIAVNDLNILAGKLASINAKTDLSKNDLNITNYIDAVTKIHKILLALNNLYAEYNKILNIDRKAWYEAIWEKNSNQPQAIGKLNGAYGKSVQNYGQNISSDALFEFTNRLLNDINKFKVISQEISKLKNIINYRTLYNNYKNIFNKDSNISKIFTEILLDVNNIANEINKANTSEKNDREATLNSSDIDKVKNWDAEYKRITQSKTSSSEQIFTKLQSFWDNYFLDTDIWGSVACGKFVKDNYAKSFKHINSELGFTKIKNPFITFVKNLFAAKITPSDRSFAEIYNNFAREAIDEKDLLSKENVLLFSQDFYEKNNREIDEYLKIYKKNIDLNKAKDNNIIIKYKNKEQDFKIDWFFNPGNVLANSNVRVEGDPKSKLYSLNKINDVYEKVFGTKLITQKNKYRINTDKIIKNIDNLDDAKIYIHFLLEIYGEKIFNNKKEIQNVRKKMNIDSKFINSIKPDAEEKIKNLFSEYNITDNDSKSIIYGLINKFLKQIPQKETTK